MIRNAVKEDVEILADLAILMWDNHTIQDLTATFKELMKKDSAEFFLLFEEEELVGFAQCQLRCDYVEGTESSPVGYLEGIFVKEECRGKGYAKGLLEECQKWASAKGCIEFASDCELENELSLKFHLSMGFLEANRIICFTKRIS